MIVNRALHGYSPTDIAQICNVSLQTSKRWKKTGKMPTSALKLFWLLNTNKVLPFDRWAGWQFNTHSKNLVTPEGVEWRPEDVQALWFLKQLESEIMTVSRISGGVERHNDSKINKLG